MNRLQAIFKAYLRGVWDSVKGVSLIFIVIRDTYTQNTNLENDQSTANRQDGEVDESSSSSTNTISGTRVTRRIHSRKREQNKLKE